MPLLARWGTGENAAMASPVIAGRDPELQGVVGPLGAALGLPGNRAEARRSWSRSSTSARSCRGSRRPTLVLHRPGRTDELPSTPSTSPSTSRARSSSRCRAGDAVSFGDGFEAWLEAVEEFTHGTIGPRGRRARPGDGPVHRHRRLDRARPPSSATGAGARCSSATTGHPRARRRLRRRAIKSTGDGFLATFDGPARAVRCATTLGERVGELGIELRAGLHTGEVEMIGADVGGMAVHIGARIGASAAPARCSPPRPSATSSSAPASSSTSAASTSSRACPARGGSSPPPPGTTDSRSLATRPVSRTWVLTGNMTDGRSPASLRSRARCRVSRDRRSHVARRVAELPLRLARSSAQKVTPSVGADQLAHVRRIAHQRADQRAERRDRLQQAGRQRSRFGGLLAADLGERSRSARASSSSRRRGRRTRRPRPRRGRAGRPPATSSTWTMIDAEVGERRSAASCPARKSASSGCRARSGRRGRRRRRAGRSRRAGPRRSGRLATSWASYFVCS